MTLNQEAYKKFCENIDYIPIFLEWWWIDSVTGGEWDVVFSLTNDNIIKGAMPFQLRRVSKIFSIIKMPKQTQIMGCWFNYPKNQKFANKLSFEKEVMHELIDQLPNVDYFMQRFHYSILNWLPFYWKGFKQTTQYTYVLDNIGDLERVKNNMLGTQKRQLKKAKKLQISVYEEKNIDKFYEMNRLSFQRQNINIKYSKVFLENLHEKIMQRDQGVILFAKDSDNNAHAAIYVIWDQKSAYLMWSGGDPEYRNSGAKTLLVYEAIKICSSFVNRFDFEGSMMKNIEQYNKSWGAIPVPYHKIYKFNSRLFEFFYMIKEWKNARQ